MSVRFLCILCRLFKVKSCLSVISFYLGDVSPLTVLCVSQIQSLVTDSAGHKLLVLSGQSSDHGGLLLQSGVFTFQNFLCVFADPVVSRIYCPLTEQQLNGTLMIALVLIIHFYLRNVFVGTIDKKTIIWQDIQTEEP